MLIVLLLPYMARNKGMKKTVKKSFAIATVFSMSKIMWNVCIWCGCKIQEGTWRETVDSPTRAGQEKSRRVWVAHLIFGLEPLVLHRRLGDSVAGEAQVVARHQSHRLGLNDDLQGWNVVEKSSFLLHRFDRTTHREGTAKTPRWHCVFLPEGLRHSRASELPRVWRWSMSWPAVQPRSPISRSSMRLGLPSGCSTFREHTSNSSSLWMSDGQRH